jgi:hypothetical protein
LYGTTTNDIKIVSLGGMANPLYAFCSKHLQPVSTTPATNFAGVFDTVAKLPTVIWFRIQHFGLNTDLDPIRIQGFDDQKLKKLTAKKKTSKLQKKPSALKRKHPALQNMKFLNFFLLL